MHAMSSPTRLLVSAVALLFIVTTNIIVVVDAASNGIQFLVNFDDGTANDLLGKHHGALQGGGTSINNGFATLTNGLIRFANPTTLDFSTSYTWYLRFRSSDSSGCLLCRSPNNKPWNQVGVNHALASVDVSCYSLFIRSFFPYQIGVNHALASVDHFLPLPLLPNTNTHFLSTLPYLTRACRRYLCATAAR